MSCLTTLKHNCYFILFSVLYSRSECYPTNTSIPITDKLLYGKK